MQGRLCAATLLCAGVAAYGQTGTKQFEVASIKPAPPPLDGKLRVSMNGDAGRIDYSNVSLKDVIRQAYKVKDYQITAPAWMENERYDLVAKLPEGASEQQVPEMLQNLLAERFQLKLRKEVKEFPVYALVVGKSGPKLEKADGESVGEAGGVKLKGSEGGGQVKKVAGGGGSMQVTDGKLQARHATLSGLAEMLSRFVDRPVVDMTNVSGFYDFTLDISIMDLKKQMIRASAPGAGGPKGDGGVLPENEPSATVFTAVQQLGLKMEPRKAPLEFLVIEKAERVPSEN